MTAKKENSLPTRERILQSARRQFLSLGFQAASIRAIASDAGFTPGALYGCFPSKEALFYAVTDPLMNRILALLDGFEARILALPPEKRLRGMHGVFLEGIPELVGLIFEDQDIVRLVIRGSRGTRYENFLSDLARRDARAAGSAVDAASGPLPGRFGAETLNLLMEGYIATLFHLIDSGRDREEVARGMAMVGKVYEAGILALMQDGPAGSKEKEKNP